MKFSAQLAAACLATSAMAGTIAIRSLQDFEDVLTGLEADVDSLDAAVNAFTGDETPVLAAATTLIDDINAGNTKLSTEPQLSVTDALTLNGEVTTFKQHAQTLVNDLKTQLPAVEAAGDCADVQTQIANINTASQQLIDTMVSKVPAAVQSIAKSQADGITQILDDAQTAYASCVNA